MISRVRMYLPELEQHFSLLGQFLFVWNNIEFDLDWLIGSFILTGDPEDALEKPNEDSVHMLVSKLGNRDRLVMLRAVAAQFPMGAQLADRIDLVTSAFSILNDNRNALVHSRFIYAGKMGSMTWARPSRATPGRAAHATAPLRVLKSQLVAAERLEWHLSELSMAVRSRRSGWETKHPWPRKFALPQRLQQPDPSSLYSVKPLPPKRKMRKSRSVRGSTDTD